EGERGGGGARRSPTGEASRGFRSRGWRVSRCDAARWVRCPQRGIAVTSTVIATPGSVRAGSEMPVVAGPGSVKHAERIRRLAFRSSAVPPGLLYGLSLIPSSLQRPDPAQGGLMFPLTRWG